jgi:nucleoside-diphosphate-sugar epimerase
VAEEAMLKLHADRGLPVSILRPAVVVGEGGAPFHSALGAFNTETYCVGWNNGKNPLPFVLAEDVASAVIAALDADLEAVSGKAFNLVGDVRWTARQYIDELAKATGRPLKFQSNSNASTAGMEWLKFVAKKVSGRKGVPAPSSRDLKSRGMVSEIDTATEKRVLGWQPVADEAKFRERAILVHRD